MAIGTTAPSSARAGATNSTMPSAPGATGRFSKSEPLSLPQIAVSGSGGSLGGLAARAAVGNPRSEQSTNRMSICREGYSYGSAKQARVFAFGTVAAQHDEALIPAMLARLRDAFCFCEGGY